METGDSTDNNGGNPYIVKPMSFEDLRPISQSKVDYKMSEERFDALAEQMGSGDAVLTAYHITLDDVEIAGRQPKTELLAVNLLENARGLLKSISEYSAASSADGYIRKNNLAGDALKDKVETVIFHRETGRAAFKSAILGIGLSQSESYKWQEVDKAVDTELQKFQYMYVGSDVEKEKRRTKYRAFLKKRIDSLTN